MGHPLAGRDGGGAARLKVLAHRVLTRNRLRDQGPNTPALNVGPAAAMPEQVDEDSWGAVDWLAHFEERAAIREYEGGLSRAGAEVLAYNETLPEWIRRNPPELVGPDQCAFCGWIEPDRQLGTGNGQVIFLHAECVDDWATTREQQAQAALSSMGVLMPAGVAKG